MQARETLADVFWRRVEVDGDQPAVFIKEGGVFRGRTWRTVADDVVRAAGAFEAAGIGRGDRVAQVSENRYEWLTTDLAALSLGAIHVPIHAPLTGEQIVWETNDSGAKLLILSGEAQAKKVAAAGKQATDTLKLLAYDACETRVNGRAVTRLHDLQRDIDAAGVERRLQQLRSLIQPDDPATLLYTSGTTGRPRGVLLSHRNLVFDASATLAAFGDFQRDRRLNFLPLSHIFARTCDWYVSVVAGSEIGLAESRETIFDDCALFQPKVLNGVPYFFDKVRRTLIERGGEQNPEALRRLLGGRITLCNSGGAALPGHVFDFFFERGVPLREGYGLSESSPVITLSTEDRYRRGSVGTALPGVEIRVNDQGEILTRGPHVMLGYWNDPPATAAAIRDGWLHTGDLGRIDDAGFLYVTGRIKELIVLASGKKVEPSQVESLLTADPLIIQACVIGDGRNYLTALLVPNPDVLRAEIRKARLWVFSRGQALRHRRVRQWFEAAVRTRLENLAPWEQVKKFTLLGRGFTIESGELTPKLSLRRKEIERHLAAEIHAMY